MPKLFDESGNEVVAFTKDEVDAQLEAFKTANPDKSGELEKLQTELKTKEEELEKLKGKDLNFANLRTQKEAAEAKAEALRKEIDDKVNAVKKDVLEAGLKDHKEDLFKSLAGKDDELRKKIEFHYNRLQDPAGTKEEIVKKVTDAWVLATKPENTDTFNTAAIGSGGVNRIQTKQSAPFTTEEKAVGARFGLSDEDFKKYGGAK